MVALTHHAKQSIPIEGVVLKQRESMAIEIEVVKYDKKWEEQFSRLEQEIGKALSALNPSIEHIGSTSVVGLSAKPIIDILVGGGA